MVRKKLALVMGDGKPLTRSKCIALTNSSNGIFSPIEHDIVVQVSDRRG